MRSRTWGTQAQGLVADQLVGREAVVELNYLYITRTKAALAVHSIRCLLRHVVAHLYMAHHMHNSVHVHTCTVEWTIYVHGKNRTTS